MAARKKKKEKPPAKTAAGRKVQKVMDEWEAGTLHSGSKKGPIVRSQKQAVAIALHQSGQARKKRRK